MLSLVLSLLPIPASSAGKSCSEQERLVDAINMLGEFTNENAALLRTDTEYSFDESVERLEKTIRNAEAPVVVDDRAGDQHWYTKLREIGTKASANSFETLSGSVLFVFTTRGSEEDYKEAVQSTGLELIFMKGACN